MEGGSGAARAIAERKRAPERVGGEAAAAARGVSVAGKKTHLFLRCYFELKMIITLPRRARDKHRENPQKEKRDPFLTGGAL